jgi:hypothetical protein
MQIVKNEEIIDDQVVTIYIEVDQVAQAKGGYYEDLRGPADQVVTAARDLFGDGLRLAHNCAGRVVKSIKEMPDVIRPDEFQVQLAIRLDSQVGAVLAKMGAEAQMRVSMKWERKEQGSASAKRKKAS